MSEVDKISALGNAAIERSRERRRPIGTKSVALRRQHLYKKLGRVLVAGGIVLIGAALFGALIKPLGFDWKIGTASIGAFAAKEVFVAQMGIVYSVGEADEESVPLRDKLRENYSPLVGFCIMLFSLISAPCMATIAVTKRESRR